MSNPAPQSSMVFFQCPVGPYGDDVLCTQLGPSTHKGFFYVQHDCLVTEVHESDMRQAEDDLLHDALNSFDDMMSLAEVCAFDNDVHQGMLKLAASVLFDDTGLPPDDHHNKKKCTGKPHKQKDRLQMQEPDIEEANVDQPEDETPQLDFSSDTDDDTSSDEDTSSDDDEVLFLKVVKPSEVQYVMTRRPCRELRL